LREQDLNYKNALTNLQSVHNTRVNELETSFADADKEFNQKRSSLEREMATLVNAHEQKLIEV
jgi:hypothetical protein